MERLTERELCGGTTVFPQCLGCFGDCVSCEHQDNANEKLKRYEDLEEQGLLLRLPCKVGDTLYVVGTKCLEYKEPNEYWCNTHSCEECVYDQEYVVFEREATKDLVFTVLMRNNPNFVVGKSVFATKAEAEKKLAEMGE